MYIYIYMYMKIKNRLNIWLIDNQSAIADNS